MIRTMAGLVSALALTAALGACATTGATPAAPETPPVTAPADYVRDVHSYARPEIARVTHVDLDLTTDFATKTVSGAATLTVTAQSGATEIILDVRNLDIRGVRDAAGAPLQFTLGADDPIMGQPMTVRFPAFAAGETRKIRIDYASRPDSAALQWLTPAQTAGGQKPYMFSQGQAILTRTWVPTQDSPGIRQTYSARIVTPADLKAVMSAEMLTPDGEAAGPNQKAWRFKMDLPVPPYLIAVGVGDVAFGAIDERTGVWTEPKNLARDVWELEPTARMVDEAETLYGPYRWGRYDLLVLPPAFPFGGMENPRLTFATPTIVAGDRSLVSLVAHELAHSWSGNLVTNATWDDFWLNEGFTSYFENRIMEAIYGRELAVQEQALAWQGLQDDLKDMAPADTHLHLNLAGRDPDDGMNSIAYDKGAAFLRTIEETAGRERFDAWLRGYFDRNAFRPMTDERFLTDLREHLIKGDAALESSLQLNAWIYGPGIPSNAKAPVSHAFEPVDAAAQAFYIAKGPVSAVPWKDWNTQQRQRFLSWRPTAGTSADWLTPAQLADLESTLKLKDEGNAELVFAWLQIAVAHRYQPAVPTLEHFLTSQGRRKFVLPLFVSLWGEDAWGRDLARRIYAEARPLYHPVTFNSVDAVVGRP